MADPCLNSDSGPEPRKAEGASCVTKHPEICRRKVVWSQKMNFFCKFSRVFSLSDVHPGCWTDPMVIWEFLVPKGMKQRPSRTDDLTSHNSAPRNALSSCGKEGDILKLIFTDKRIEEFVNSLEYGGWSWKTLVFVFVPSRHDIIALMHKFSFQSMKGHPILCQNNPLK